MAFKELSSLETENTVTIGGVNRKTNKPNPKTVEGYFIGTKGGIPNKFNPDKPNQLHVLQTKAGNVGVWGKTNLDQKMKSVPPGTMIRISFTGTKPSNKGNDMLLYKVEADAENTIEVSGQSNEAYAPASDEDEAVAGFSYGDEEEADVDADETPADEVAPVRTATRNPVKAPDPARAAKVQALLSRAKQG